MFITWKVKDIWDEIKVIPAGVLVCILFCILCSITDNTEPPYWKEWEGNPKSNYPRHCKIFLYQTR